VNQNLEVAVLGPELRPFYLFEVGDFLVNDSTGAVGVKTDEVSVLWMTGDNVGRVSNALRLHSSQLLAAVMLHKFIVPAGITIEVEL